MSTKTIDEIREALHRIHRYATGQSDRSYMSIPADPERDADLIVARAIDELAALREQRRVLREALEDARQNIGAMIAPPSLPDPAQGWGVEARRRIAAALDATKEEP